MDHGQTGAEVLERSMSPPAYTALEKGKGRAVDYPEDAEDPLGVPRDSWLDRLHPEGMPTDPEEHDRLMALSIDLWGGDWSELSDLSDSDDSDEEMEGLGTQTGRRTAGELSALSELGDSLSDSEATADEFVPLEETEDEDAPMDDLDRGKKKRPSKASSSSPAKRLPSRSPKRSAATGPPSTPAARKAISATPQRVFSALPATPSSAGADADESAHGSTEKVRPPRAPRGMGSRQRPSRALPPEVLAERAANRTPARRPARSATSATPSLEGQPLLVTPSPKKRTPKGSSMGPKPKRKNAKLGKLQRFFTDAPAEIVWAIMGLCDPWTLLRLARTSKGIRAKLMSSNAKSMWIESLRGVGIEEDILSTDWNLPMWVRLVFEKHCMACGTPKINRVNYFARLRLCEPCLKRSFLSQSKITELAAEGELVDHASEGMTLWKQETEIYAFPTKAGEENLNAGLVHPSAFRCILGHNGLASEDDAWRTTTENSYYLPHVLAVSARLKLLQRADEVTFAGLTDIAARTLAIASQGELAAFVKGKQEVMRLANKDALMLREFDKRLAAQARENDRLLLSKRKETIIARCLEMGFEEEDVKRTLENVPAAKAAVNQPYPLTPRVWKKQSVIVAAAVAAERDARRLRELATRKSERVTDILERYGRFITASTIRAFLNRRSHNDLGSEAWRALLLEPNYLFHALGTVRDLLADLEHPLWAEQELDKGPLEAKLRKDVGTWFEWVKKLHADMLETWPDTIKVGSKEVLASSLPSLTLLHRSAWTCSTCPHEYFAFADLPAHFLLNRADGEEKHEPVASKGLTALLQEAYVAWAATGTISATSSMTANVAADWTALQTFEALCGKTWLCDGCDTQSAAKRMLAAMLGSAVGAATGPLAEESFRAPKMSFKELIKHGLRTGHPPSSSQAESSVPPRQDNDALDPSLRLLDVFNASSSATKEPVDGCPHFRIRSVLSDQEEEAKKVRAQLLSMGFSWSDTLSGSAVAGSSTASTVAGPSDS